MAIKPPAERGLKKKNTKVLFEPFYFIDRFVPSLTHIDVSKFYKENKIYTSTFFTISLFILGD